MKKARRISIFIWIAVLLLPHFLISPIALPVTAQAVGNVTFSAYGGAYHSFSINSDGNVYAFGANLDGQLGLGNTTPKTVPTLVFGGAKSISSGWFHGAAVKQDNTLWTWGDNAYGQIGNNSTTDQLSPVHVLSDVKAVSAGGGHTLALKTNNLLYAFGCNEGGQIGNGNTTNKATPVSVFFNVAKIAAGGDHSMAIRTDNSLWMWGWNDFGQIGNNSLTNQLLPLKLMENVSQIAAGYGSSFAVKTDGTLWAWGRNDYGQLGDGTTINRHTPVQIMDNVASVSAGYDHALCIRTDGSLWSWGWNVVGQLGNGTTVDELRPIKIRDGVDSVSSGLYHNFAIMQDDSVWAWGYNYFSQLGNNATAHRPAPFKLYNGTATAQTVSGTYAIISNENPDTNISASTGTFLQKNEDAPPNTLPLETYQMDFVQKPNPNVSPVVQQKSRLGRLQTLTLDVQIDDTRTFFTYNVATDSYEQTTATLRAIGTECEIWVKVADFDMSYAQAQQMATEFDTQIFPDITPIFGEPSDVNSDNRVAILCFDIKDGFSGSGGYIAGYFDCNDLYANDTENPYSNETEVFYIDTYPAMGTTTKNVTKCYDTIAHEFQHMVNFNQNVFIEGGDDMAVWLDEGLAEAASQVYSGTVLSKRINLYNSSSLITSGLSVLTWQQILENYALSYLFLQYVKEQAGIGDHVFTEIMQSAYSDYRAIEEVIHAHIDPSLTFGQFLTNFRAALLLKRPTGPYGFMGNAGFNSLVPRIYTGGETNLFGGGAVVVAATAGQLTIPDNAGQDVTYLILGNPPVISGVEDAGIYNTNRTITFDKGTATLNGNPITSGTTVNSDGNYTLIVTDIETNVVTIHFVIDKTAPQVLGVNDTAVYNFTRTITFSDGTATLNGLPFSSGTPVSEIGNYTLIVTDSATNATTVQFNIADVLIAWQLNDDILSGINAGTTSAPFAEGFTLAPTTTLTLKNRYGTVLLPSSLIGTGATAELTDDMDTIFATYTCLIYGDVQGNGLIDALDLLAVKRHLLHLQSLTGIDLLAADATQNDVVTSTDLLKIQRIILHLE